MMRVRRSSWLAQRFAVGSGCGNAMPPTAFAGLSVCSTAVSCRHKSTGPTMGEQFKRAGVTMSTPSFGDIGSLGDAPDLGDVQTKPASNFTLRDAHGPWILLSETLQGELFVEPDGTVFFRPGASLGNGIGKITLQESSIGATTFKLELETYLYANVAEYPPTAPERFEVVGIVATATAAKQNYKTFTLAGQMQRLRKDGSGAAETIGSVNAAKMNPWSADAAPPKWTPSAEVRDAFQQIFPTPLRIDSHVKRALAAKRSGCAVPAHLDLSRFRVGDIQSVYYVPDYITADEESQMMDQLRGTPEMMKSKLTKRLVQEWGCSMCKACNKSFVPDANLPPWTEAVNDMLLHDGIFSPSIFPNNVRIHEYEVGEGIAPHVDGPIYVPRVAILSLASTSVMGFYPRQEPHKEPMEHYNDTFRFDGDIAKHRPHMSIVLEPRSLLIFEGEAYTHYPHGISDKAVDSLDESVAGFVANRHLLSAEMRDACEVRRQYRVGVTVRNLLPRCNHEPGRAEHCMRHAVSIYNQQGLFPNPATAPPPHGKSNNVASRNSGNATAAAAATKAQTSQPSPPVSPSASVPYTHHGGDDSIKGEIAELRRTQTEILTALHELKAVVAHTTATSAAFQKEMATVMNYMSSTVLELQAKVDDVADDFAASQEQSKGK